MDPFNPYGTESGGWVALDVFLPLIVIAFAGYRLARIVTKDSISDPFRAWLWREAFVKAGYDSVRERDVIEVRSRVWWWVHEYFTCPFCVGFWLTLAVYWLWWQPPALTARHAIAAIACVGMQALLSSRRDA